MIGPRSRFQGYFRGGNGVPVRNSVSMLNGSNLDGMVFTALRKELQNIGFVDIFFVSLFPFFLVLPFSRVNLDSSLWQNCRRYPELCLTSLALEYKIPAFTRTGTGDAFILRLRS